MQLFIAEENVDATEYDYQKALALLPHVEDPIDVKHKIWCSAILRDKWDSYNINAPQEALQQLMFFKLVDLCFFMGMCKIYGKIKLHSQTNLLSVFISLDSELEQFLPPMDELLEAHELGPLTESKSFQFLLKLGYEHVFESYNKK